jgi:hypothetical protein
MKTEHTILPIVLSSDWCKYDNQQGLFLEVYTSQLWYVKICRTDRTITALSTDCYRQVPETEHLL